MEPRCRRSWCGGFCPARRTFNPHLAHQTGDRAYGDVEALAHHPSPSLPDTVDAEVLIGHPAHLDCDTREALATCARTNLWACQVAEGLDRLVAPRGKPTDDAFIKAFNARLRSEYPNASWFPSMADARSRIDAWREDYNHHRPHTSLGDLTPAELADQLLDQPESPHDA